MRAFTPSGSRLSRRARRATSAVGCTGRTRARRPGAAAAAARGIARATIEAAAGSGARVQGADDHSARRSVVVAGKSPPRGPRRHGAQENIPITSRPRRAPEMRRSCGSRGSSPQRGLANVQRRNGAARGNAVPTLRGQALRAGQAPPTPSAWASMDRGGDAMRTSWCGTRRSSHDAGRDVS